VLLDIRIAHFGKSISLSILILLLISARLVIFRIPLMVELLDHKDKVLGRSSTIV
jgi:hypothetical protein